MPTLFAWVTLALWPLLVIVIYAARRASARLARTTAWMMVLPVMFLPTGLEFKVAGIPYIDKDRISFISIAIALQLFHRKDLLGKARGHNIPRVVLLVLLLATVVTVRTNADALTVGPTILPGLTLHDVFSLTAARLLDLYLPFAVGQRVFRTERDLRDLLEVLSICGLIYAPLCLIEMRFSPQLHYWVYGYYPSQFLQAIREGGYRPVVFMRHGLNVAMFFFTCFCSSLALRKVKAALHPVSAAARVGVNGLFVLLCRSLAAIIYSAGALVAQLALSTRALGRLLTLLVVLMFVYPASRISGAFPVEDTIQFFARINPARAESLLFRFRNENALIERANKRAMFGWGTFGRNRIYDPWSGKDISVTDGTWIIELGQFGYAGLASFGSLLLFPLLRFLWRRSRMPQTSQVLLGALALIVTVYTVDLFPNSYANLLIFAFAGALFTLSGNLRRPRRTAPRPVDRFEVASVNRVPA